MLNKKMAAAPKAPRGLFLKSAHLSNLFRYSDLKLSMLLVFYWNFYIKFETTGTVVCSEQFTGKYKSLFIPKNFGYFTIPGGGGGSKWGTPNWKTNLPYRSQDLQMTLLLCWAVMHQSEKRIRIRTKAKSRIRIRIKVKIWNGAMEAGGPLTLTMEAWRFKMVPWRFRPVEQWSQISITSTRSRIRIHIKVKSRIQIWIEVKSRIRIRIIVKKRDPDPHQRDADP